MEKIENVLPNNVDDLEYDPKVPGAQYEHGVPKKVEKEQSLKILELLKNGPKDYAELRSLSGLDDEKLNHVLNFLANRVKIKKTADYKFILA